MNSLSGRRLTPLIVFCTLLLAPPAWSAFYDTPQEIVARGTSVFRGFMADPNMEWFRRNVHQAKGIFIVPQMLRGGFIFGGSGGSGILLAQNYQTGKWSAPAFYTMGSVSFGLQIGADSSEIILLVMTDRGLSAMLSTEFKLGADVAVAAGPIGASAKAQTVDILAFGRSQGAFGGISIEGAVINPRGDWNQQYYGKPVLPVDILLHQNVSNEQAEALRQLLPQKGHNVKPLGR